MSVSELTVSIVGDMSKLSSVFSKVEKEAGSLGNSFTSLGSKMGSTVSSGLTTLATTAAVTGTALGVGLVAAGQKSLSMFNTFEKSVSNAASVTGLAGDAFAAAKVNISAVAQELGQKTAFSSSQAADALYELASAGVDVSQITSDKLIPILNLASGTQYDLAQTTGIVTSTLSQFGLGFDEAGRVSDVFAKSAALSQASMDKLQYSMAQVGTIAKTAGLSLEDTTAALSKMYDAGMDGSSAGTGLKGVLASLMAPTSQATDIFKSMGLTLDDINPTTNKFSDIIQKLKDRGLDGTKAFQLFGREGAPAIMGLVSQSDGLKTMTDNLKEAGGAAQQMADQQLDTLAGSWDSFTGSIENLWINVGQALAPTARTVIDSLNSMIPSVQTWIVAIVQGFVGFVGQLGDSISSIKTIGSTVIDVFKNIFSSVFGGGSGIGNSAADMINGIMNRIAGIIVEYAPVIQNAVISVIGFFKNLATGLQPTYISLQSIATRIITVFRELFSGISGSGFVTVINTISALLARFVVEITTVFFKVAPTIKSIFSTIVSTVQGFIPIIKNAWNSISGAFSNIDLSAIINSLKSTFQGIDFAGIFNSVVSTLKGIDFTGIFNSLKTAFDTGKSIITGFISELSPSWDNLKSSFESIKKIIDDVAPSFSGLFDSFSAADGASSASSTLAGIINVLTGAIAGLLKWLADNPAVIKFGLALAGVAVAAGGLIIGLAGVITALTPIWALVTSGIAIISTLSFSWASLGTVVSLIGTTLFPTLSAAITTVASAALPILSAAFGALSTVIGIIVYTVIPILVEAFGLLISPVGLIIAGIALLAVAWTRNWGNIQGRTAQAVAFIKNNWNKFTAELGRLPGVASAALSTLKSTILSKWNAIIADAQSWVQKQVNKYNDAIAKLNQFKVRVIAKWNEIKAGILAKLNNIVADAQAWVTKQTAKYNDAVAKLSNFKTQAINKWNEIKAGILVKLNAIIADVQNWIQKQVNKYNDAVAKLHQFKTRVIAKWNEIKTAIKNKLDDIVTELKNKKATIKNELDKIVTTIKNKVADFKSAGKALIQGLIDGIEDKITGVKNAMSKVTNAADGFLTHSPAKEGPFKTLPTFDAVLYDPLMDTINKTESGVIPRLSQVIGKISNPLSNIKSPIDSSLSGGLSNVSTSVSNISNTVSNIANSTANNYGGDTLNLGGVSISDPINLQAIFTQFEKYTANKRRAGGYRG